MKMSEMPFSPDFFTVLAVCWSNEPPPDALKRRSLIWGSKCGLRNAVKRLIEGDVS